MIRGVEPIYTKRAMIRFFLLLLMGFSLVLPSYVSAKTKADSETSVEISVPFDHFRPQDWDQRILMKYDPEARQSNKSMLLPPFDPNSEEQQNEIEYIRTITKARTATQEKQFKDMKDDPVSHLLTLLGLDDEELIETRLLLASGLETLNKKIWEEKWRYQRLRPTQFDPFINSLKPLPGSASYPAEKAAQAKMAAYILTDLYPDHDYIWMGWAEFVGKQYELAGLQFPSDTHAGYDLAERYYIDLKGDIEYKNMILNSNIELINKAPKIKKLVKEIGPITPPSTFP